MSRLPIWLALLILSIVSVVVSAAQQAQAQYSGYRPSRPTLSPYFDLYRRNTGPLGPYFSDFRPRQDFRRAIQQAAAGLQQENSSLRALDQRLSLFERPAQSVRPTGTASVFMNYSHYYQSQRTAQTRSSGGRRSWSPSAARSGGYSGY